MQWLTLARVQEIHAITVALYGGDAGLRDQGLLASALAQPQASFGGQLLHPTLAAKAAAYHFHLVRNHAFIDGNKRVGAAAAAVFLRMNGLRLTASNEAYEALTMGVAAGSIDKDQVTTFFQDHTAPL